MARTDNLVSSLREIVGEANIIEDRERLKAFSIDGKKPKVIVSPGTAEEVSKVIAFANGKRSVVIPRGNGTKMQCGGVPRKIDILLWTTRLNRITDKDCDNLTLSVEGGMTLAKVQETLAREGKGYFLPLDPPFQTKRPWGIVATNSSGPRRLLYGAARD